MATPDISDLPVPVADTVDISDLPVPPPPPPAAVTVAPETPGFWARVEQALGGDAQAAEVQAQRPIAGAEELAGSAAVNAIPYSINSADRFLKDASAPPTEQERRVDFEEGKSPDGGDLVPSTWVAPGAEGQKLEGQIGSAAIPGVRDAQTGKPITLREAAQRMAQGAKGEWQEFQQDRPDAAAAVASVVKPTWDAANALPLVAPLSAGVDAGVDALASRGAKEIAEEAPAATEKVAATEPAPVGPITPAEMAAQPVTEPPKPASEIKLPGQEPGTVPGPGAEKPEAPPAPGAELFKHPGDENARVPGDDRSPEERAALAQKMRDLGITETRESALTGNPREASSDHMTSEFQDEGGTRMGKVIAQEREALRGGVQGLLEQSGGSTLTGQAADKARGADMVAPVKTLEDHIDNHIQQMYAQANQKAAGQPLHMIGLNQILTGQKSAFVQTQEGEQLLKGINHRASELGILAPDGSLKPTTVEQAERLRQYIGDAYNHRIARLTYMLKDAIDDDVTKAAGENVYQQGRALRAYKSRMLEEQPGVNKLREPDDKLGIARKVALEDVPDHIENMSVDQFNHYVNTLAAAAKVSTQAAQQSARAFNQVRAHFLQRIKQIGDSTGTLWNSKGVSEYLRAHDAQLARVLRPDELRKLQDIHDVGNALRIDRHYRGAAAAQHQRESMIVKGARGALKLGGTALGATHGPIGAVVGHAGGAAVAKLAEKDVAKEVEKRIVNLADEPKPPRERIANKFPGQRGGPKFTVQTSKGKFPIEHEEGDLGEHTVRSENGETHLQEQNNGNLRAKRSDTAAAAQGGGEGTARLAAAADIAHSRGGNLESDSSVSPAEAHAYGNLARAGYKVRRDASATVNPTTNNWITDDFRKPVFTVGPKAAPAERPLAERFASQRGGPKYRATPTLEKFVKSKAPPHVVDKNGPATWEELQARGHESPLPVNPQSAEGSIYRNVPTNIAFRAWHDATHVRLGAGFDHEGELRVALEHQREAKEAGLSNEDRRALWADTWETFKHHEQTGEFPSKPREFVAQKMAEKFPGQRGGPKMEREAGSEKGAGGKTMTFRHFSMVDNPPERLTLDPKFYGKGLTGAERVRMKNEGAPKVVSAYASDHPNHMVEPELRGKAEYRVTVPASKMYDLSIDPHGIREAATEGGVYDHSEAERQVAARGYTGYYTPHHANPLFRGQARFFKPVEGVKVGPKATVNIGLKVGESGSISAQEAMQALARKGVKITQSAVHQSGTEPTLVAHLDRALTPEEAHAVSAELHQEAIAQHTPEGGELHGPGAEAWRPFQGKYFLKMNGKPLEASRPPLKQEYDPAGKLYDEQARRDMEAAQANPNGKRPPLQQGGAAEPTPAPLYRAPRSQRGGAIPAPGVKLPKALAANTTPEERALFTRKAAQQDLVRAFHEAPSEKELGALALAGRAKRGWYEHASKAIANVFGGDGPRFTALLAAMSPQASVEMNFHNALHTFTAWAKAGRPTDRATIERIMEENSMKDPESKSKSNVLDAWRHNAVRALTAKDPETVAISGPKVSSFMHNLRGHVNEVTLDSWMATVARMDPKILGGLDRKATDGLSKTFSVKSPGYVGYAAKVRAAAGLLTRMTGETWTPAEVQETVWSWAKTATEHANSFKGLATIPELAKNGEIHDDLIKGTSDFHTLFERPEHRAVLADSEFAKGLGRLHAERAPEPRPPSEAETAARKALQPHFEKAARRVEKSRQDRRALEESSDDVPF